MIVKVSISFSNAPPKDYELNRDIPLRQHVDALVKLFNIPNANPEAYTLQINASGTYLTDEEYTSPEFSVATGATLNLKLKPDIAAEVSVNSLTPKADLASKKKALFALRETLKDEEFRKQFLAKNGIEAITLLVDELTGTTLAYALSALQTAMSYDFRWENLPQSFVEKLLLLSDNINSNVVKSALPILIRIVESPKYGFASVSAACKATAKLSNKQPYASLIVLLGSTDVDVQLYTLTLINTLTSHAAAGLERNTFIQLLDSQEINSILKRQLGSTEPEFRKQLYIFQKHKLNMYKGNRSIPYDKTNPDHEATLMRMWTATYPDTKLENRVSEQWKLLGFQGTDPATDFRGMGLLGLEQLVYFAENHTDVFRKIVNGQIARKEREYPVAVAGINLTQKLYEILKIDDTSPDGPIFPVIFSHRHAFEEMYCTAFEVLDHTWDDMNASYMDFPKVIAAVHKQIVEVMDSRPFSIENFHTMLCYKGLPTNYDEQNNNEEPESVKKLKMVVKKEILELIKQQKLAYLTDGCVFKVLKGQQPKEKGKNVGQQYLFAKVSDNHQELGWAPISDVAERPASLANTVKIPEILSVVTGGEVPSYAKKKGAEDVMALSFAYICKDEKLSVEFLANTRDDFVNWVDGMKALIGKAMDCTETIDEAKTLVTLEMKVRLLDLEGIDIPKDPPPIPEVPTDFDFVEFREKRMSVQITEASA